MNTTSTLALIHKAAVKLKLGRPGGLLVYGLNRMFNRPDKALTKESDYHAYLDSIHKDVKTSSICENEIIASDCDLQVIIPVYNTGEFLNDCINSVLAQKTDYKYHVVIVNDGSTDNSGEILSKYEADDRITIITQENRGFSGARNAALTRIFGKYITFLDSDDMLAPGAIENWLNAAYKYDADVVEGSFLRRNPNGELFGGVCWVQESIEDKIKMQGYSWLKIYRAEIWKKIHFPEEYWYEDTIICGLILPLVQVYVQIPDYVYYYTLNKRSISFNSRGYAKSLDNIYVTESVLSDAKELGLISANYEYYYKYFIFQSHTNWDRTYLLGANIEYAVFIYLCDLFDKYFLQDTNPTESLTPFVKALRNRDFNLYRKSNYLGF